MVESVSWNRTESVFLFLQQGNIPPPPPPRKTAKPSSLQGPALRPLLCEDFQALLGLGSSMVTSAEISPTRKQFLNSRNAVLLTWLLGFAKSFVCTEL